MKKMLAVLLLLTSCAKVDTLDFEKPEFKHTSGRSGSWEGSIKIEDGSLRIETTSERKPGSYYFMGFPAKSGSTATFRIKTKDNTIAFVSTQSSWDQRILLPGGTTDWQPMQITCIENVLFFVAEGKGTVWIDDIKIK